MIVFVKGENKCEDQPSNLLLKWSYWYENES